MLRKADKRMGESDAWESAYPLLYPLVGFVGHGCRLLGVKTVHEFFTNTRIPTDIRAFVEGFIRGWLVFIGCILL
jgi:hypothetical protein